MYPSPAPQQPSSWLVRLVMRLSGDLLKNEQQANQVLLAFAVVMLVITIYLFARPSTPNAPPLSERAHNALMQRDAQSRPANHY